jgi:HEAT repeat protein
VVGLAALLGTGTAVAVAATRAQQRRRARARASVRPLLFRALDDGDLTAVSTLGKSQQRELDRQARSLLPSLRGADRDTLARILARRGAVEAAHRQTTRRSPGARARAAGLLGEAGGADALSDLIALLRDPHPDVRMAAARGLGRVGHPGGVAPLLAALEGHNALPADLVADAIYQIRECPFSVLRQGLRSRSAPARAVTAELVGRYGALAATDDLIDLVVSDPSVEVRSRAARSLGRIGSPRAIEPLLACLEGSPAAVLAQAVWALGEVGAPQAVPALRSALRGPSHQLSEWAADALAGIAPDGVEALSHISQEDGHAGLCARRALRARQLREPAATR